MKKILIATGNPGKKKEILEAHAILKAEYYGKKTGQLTIAEDSGLILGAFPNKFGLKTKREIKAKDDIEWLRFFLDMLEHESDRTATFYSAFGVYNPETKKSFSVLGTTSGEIVDFPAAPIEKGIPVSAVFRPDGELDVYSAMSKKKKNEISHRGKAAKKLMEYLKTIA
jgi:XTP/dITP diphosphohydrolase